jgi:hypothetical protein
MLNSKKFVWSSSAIFLAHIKNSSYIVAMALANKIKSKLYQSDIPELENVRANLPAVFRGPNNAVLCNSNFVSDQMAVN